MVIAADLNGYKIDEIVSVNLPSGQTVIKVFDGGLKQTASTLPYPARYINGISVKAVDLNSDGIFGWDQGDRHRTQSSPTSKGKAF
jgi:hypothetical protein